MEHKGAKSIASITSIYAMWTLQCVPCLVQIADIRYTSKADFAGSALHILRRGTNSIVYLATAQETGLKLLLKAYDIGGQCA